MKFSSYDGNDTRLAREGDDDSKKDTIEQESTEQTEIDNQTDDASDKPREPMGPNKLASQYREEAEVEITNNSTSGKRMTIHDGPARPRRGCLWYFFLIVFTITAVGFSLTARGTRKIYSLFEPHLAEEKLPLPVVEDDEELSSSLENKITTFFSTPGAKEPITLSQDELNQLFVTSNSERLQSYIMLPPNNTLRLLISYKLPSLGYTTPLTKQRANFIIEIDASYKDNLLAGEVTQLFFGKKNLQESLGNTSSLSFSLSPQQFIKEQVEIPFSEVVIKDRSLQFSM